jgi:hypothetical protein
MVLEAFFLRMHSLHCLKNHAIGFIELALAVLNGFAQTLATRAPTILLFFGAIAFRAPLWQMEPTHSDGLQR